MSGHDVFRTRERCFECDGALLRLEPPVDGGWEYYCAACQALVASRAQYAEWATESPPDDESIGRVVAVHLKEPLELVAVR